jgi:hypothetical protein
MQYFRSTGQYTVLSTIYGNILHSEYTVYSDIITVQLTYYLRTIVLYNKYNQIIGLSPSVIFCQDPGVYPTAAILFYQ